MKSPHSGIKRIWYAGYYSWQGFIATWQGEAAFRQEVVLFILLLPLAYWLGETVLERALLVSVLLIVLIVELLNSSIETVVDRISEDYHPLSGRAKDQASAAVFLSFLAAFLVWGSFIVSKALSYWGG